MIPEPWRLDAAALPTRPVRRAALLMGMWVGREEPAMIVLDAETAEFVRVPDIPVSPSTLPLCLSGDGTAAMFLAPHQGEGQGGLYLASLATPERQRFDARADGQIVTAAMSPDGSSVAALSVSGDEASVTLLDIATRSRRLLWAAAGGSSAESTVGFSPDGRMVSATYLSMDEEWASVVVSTAEGTVIREYAQSCTLPSANGAWPNARDIYLHDEDVGISLADVETGARRFVDGHASIGLAVLGERLFGHVDDGSSPNGYIVMTDFGGAAARPIVTFRSAAHLDAFDIAPAVLRPLLFP